jgi:purine-nucleoside phosphorylase
MEERVQALSEGVERWRRLGWPKPWALVVSGSGLAVDLTPPTHGPIPLAELLPFPIGAVEGHPHSVEMLLPHPERPVLYLRGRVHSYQGYDPDQVVFPVRLAALLGAEALFMTNAAGGLDSSLRPGQLTLIRDHINLTGLNPLRGELPAQWGPRFPDMSAAYDRDLRRQLRATAEELGIALGEGVYVGLAGPSYETPAEVRMLRTLGGHLVGMSTVLEVIAARHLGLRCAALSLVTNLGAGISEEVLDHEEVIAAGKAAAADVQQLLTRMLTDAPAARPTPG